MRRLLDLNCTLIDYELIVDENQRRLIFFGRHAGYAGMIDSLWALGQRLRYENIESPFDEIQPAHFYDNLRQAQETIQEVGNQIQRQGLPRELGPVVCGFTGYGQVSKGAQAIYDLLPVVTLTPVRSRICR